MRNLIALFACCAVALPASANDPVPAVAAPKVAAPSIKPALPSIKPKVAPPSTAVSAAALAEKEAEAEAELSAKIAARLAAMRANQVARAAAAAKARKATEARKQQEALAAVSAPPVLKPYQGDHWSYEGETGPANWGRKPEWSKCATGNRQSPIDLRDGMKVDLEQIVFDYKPSAFNVTDNGHTIQVNVGPGNYITLQSRSFELLQFHFHRPSEERINGKGFEMVVHMVHKDADGKLAVLAVLLERGKPQNLVQSVWNNLPLEKLDTVTPSTVIDPAEILPGRREYFTYMGSLTTPPCSEGVLWLVMKEPVQASPAQMALFARLYPFNARPIQAHSGRVVKESN